MLLLTATLCFANRFRHRRRNSIAIQNGFTVDVTRRTTNGLNKRTLRTQEALFIGIQNRHQRHFRHVQTFS
ncbi:hypothetical protein D3C80_1659720 [compost metagenome]